MRKTSELIWQDAQHQVLFELIDQLKTKQATAEIFIQLSNFAENHFSLEETYMVKLSYPRIDEHIEAHNRFREELKAMIEERAEFDEQVRLSVATFLKEWLMRHVFGIDKDFEAFVLNSEHK